MVLASVRHGSWHDIELCDLEGFPVELETINELPSQVKAVCVDSHTGLYVLSADEDFYFTAPSIDLEFNN